jgi:hypothetical protein
MARLFYGSGVVYGYLNSLAPTLAGSVVTIQAGACWIDGYYGEISSGNTKTVAVTGTGTVVARMDPTARQVVFAFTTQALQQNLTGVFEIPIMQITSGVGKDIRQFSSPNSPNRVGARVFKLFGTHNTSTAISTMVWDYGSWGAGVSGAYFTCPINADYFMTCTQGFTSTGAGQWFHLYLCQTPAGTSTVNQIALSGTPNSAAAGLTVQTQVTDIIPCNAGDQLFVQHQSNTNGISLLGAASGFMTIRALS